MIEVIPGRTYRIRPGIPYFVKKYGEDSPTIIIENRARVLFSFPLPLCWALTGNWAARLFLERIGHKPGDYFDDKDVFYGKVRGLGECVMQEELVEEVVDNVEY